MLITTNTTHAANEHLYKTLPYDPVKDFAPVTLLGKGGQIMIVNLKVPAKTREGIHRAREEGAGQAHLRQRQLLARASRASCSSRWPGVQLLHVPYKSNPLAVTDLLGGQIDMMITDTATGLPQVKGGKVRALGVSSLKRIAARARRADHRRGRRQGLRDELLVRGLRAGEDAARGGQAPARPAGGGDQEREREELLRDHRHRSPRLARPTELAKFQAAESQKWGRIIKAANIQPE